MTKREWEFIRESLRYTQQRFMEYPYRDESMRKTQLSLVNFVLEKVRAKLKKEVKR